MFDTNVLSEVVMNFSGPSPKGISCHFIKLDNETGIKVYREKMERDAAFQNQNKMEAHGYAPKAILMFDAGKNYCYVTQVAEPVLEGKDFNIGEWNSACDRIRKEYPNIGLEIINLCDNMKKVGHWMSDAHFANFGWLNGKLVCIDFGY